MNVLREALALLTQPPGDLVYFLVTLFALQQALLPALTAYRRSEQAPTAKRWLWAIGGLLVSRVVLIVIGLLGSAGVLDPAATFPPLERALEAASVALIVWAMLEDRGARWQTWLLGILLIATVGFYVYSSQVWLYSYAAKGIYNGSEEELIWEMAALILLGIGLLSQLLLHTREWEWASGVLIFWTLGHVAQITWPTVSLYFSDWERLSALIVFPMLAVYLHRRLTVAPIPSSPSVAETTVQLPTTLDFSALQNLLEGVETARELEPSLLIASSQLAELLEAEVCAIALTENVDVPSLRVVATHPPTGDLDQPILNLTGFDTLGTAWMESEPRTIPSGQYPWLTKLYHLIGFDIIGPLLVLPMRVNKKRTGLMLLGRPESQPPWPDTMVEAARLTALLLAGSIDRVQRRGGSIFSLRQQEGYVLEDLANAQSEIAALKKHISSLKDDLETRNRSMARLRQELEQRSAHVSETELKVWQNEIQELAQERDDLIQERNSLGKELAKSNSRFDLLKQKYTRLQRQLKEAREVQVELTADKNNGTGLAVGLLVVDEDGTIRMADALARRLLALPEGEVVGLPVDGVYSNPAWAQTIDTLLTSDPTAPQRAHLTLDLRDHTVEADLVQLTGRDGHLDGLVVTLKTEESLAEKQEALIGLVNEFRTPMTSISGYADLLIGEQAGILTEMQRQFLERVKASVEQMQQQLNDLIRLTSPDARRVDLAPQPIDLIEIIEQAIMGLSARFRERRLTVQLDLPPKLPPVQADRDSLYQIMLRLLSNAALCSEEGSGIIVSAALRENNGDDVPAFIRISVIDTGGGIAPDDLSKVFRRFFRAHQPLIEGMGERGIGMAIAKALVEANGGRIWVDTEPGVGSTFSFVLPAYMEEETKATAANA